MKFTLAALALCLSGVIAAPAAQPEAADKAPADFG